MGNRISRRSSLLGFGLAAALLLADATPAAAQYFGRNKVQYETFDFQVMHTPHFQIHFYPEKEEAAREVARTPGLRGL